MWTHVMDRGEMANQMCLLGNMDETTSSYKYDQKKPPAISRQTEVSINLSKAFSRQGILSQIIQRLGQYTSNKHSKEGALAFVTILSKH